MTYLKETSCKTTHTQLPWKIEDLDLVQNVMEEQQSEEILKTIFL
jgi:hypothetical protein